MDEVDALPNSSFPSSGDGGVAWTVADQDDADTGRSFLDRLLDFRTGAPSVSQPFPAASGAGLVSNLSGTLDKLLNYNLQRDALNGQLALARMGRGVAGYPYGYGTPYAGAYPYGAVGGQPNIGLLLLLGLGFLAIKGAVK